MDRPIHRLALSISAWVGAAALPASAAFVDATQEAGVSYTQHFPSPIATRCQITGNNRFTCEPMRMTGAAAAGDYDNDGHIDLFVTRYRDASILFRNNGDGAFTEAMETGIPKIDYANCAGWVDIEHDGDLDLFVGTVGGMQYHLFVNDGEGRFSEQARLRGVDCNTGTPHLAWGIAFGDYDSDGWTDIFTCEWGSRLVVPQGAKHHSRLFRNRGGNCPGLFADVTDKAGVDLRALNPAGLVYGFAPAFTDLDQDGHPDLAIAADFSMDTLLWNNGDGTFTDGTDAAGVNTAENGMGSTFADYDLDGDLDWFITSIYDPEDTCGSGQCNWGNSGNRLFRNEGNRIFADVTDVAGVRIGWWGWGASFFDFDNDVDMDLVMTNGFENVASSSLLGQFRNDPMMFWINDGTGAFAESAAASGITSTDKGKGLLTFDYDADGDLDLFVTNNGSTPVLYKNATVSGNTWLRIRFTSQGLPFDIKNAKVWVTPGGDAPVQYRETGVSTHFLGQSEPELHFGLGQFEEPAIERVTVEWPISKVRQNFDNMAIPGAHFTIEIPEEERPVIAPLVPHSADYRDSNGALSLSELLRIIQLHGFSYYRPAAGGEGGFTSEATPPSATSGYHDADYAPSDWKISLNELLRVVQIYNCAGYRNASDEEDGFLPLTHEVVAVLAE